MTASFKDKTVWLGRHIFPHESALRNWLRRRELAGLEIDDVVQETFSRLVMLESLDHIQHPKTYLFQTASSVLVDHLRRMKVVSFYTLADLEALELAVDEPSPEDIVVARDELKTLARALARLPARVREVFQLRRLEGLSQRAVAQQLRISESTVEKHMARGALFIADFQADGGNAADTTSNVRKRRSRRAYVQGDRSRD